MKTTSQPFNYWQKPEAKTAGVNRFFYRCPSCLVVLAVDEQNNNLHCETCREGEKVARMEFMGRVQADNLVREYDKPVCDDRCTSARGPVCVCRCLGANHGSHMWVTVKETIAGVPSVSAPKDAEKYREQAEQFNRGRDLALACIKARFGADNFARYMAGTWINDRGVWGGIRYSLEQLNRLWRAREHKSRMKKLAALILQVKESRAELN